MDYRQRRKEQARRTEQAILQAALALAREHSFDKVSVRDICQRSGITTGAFYHHFRSKEDLLSRGFAPLDLYMEQALAGHGADAPPEQLWRILSSYAAFIEALGWELVARYYQRRLDSPDDASSMDPTRYTLRAMLDCLHQAEAQGILLPGQWWSGRRIFSSATSGVWWWTGCFTGVPIHYYPGWSRITLCFRTFFRYDERPPGRLARGARPFTSDFPPARQIPSDPAPPAPCRRPAPPAR